MNGDRLDKLDNAFLFILSFVGLLITIIQGFFFGAGVKSLVEILPLLFLGIGIPLYVGYLRGAITIVTVNHSIVERMRGWLYLIMGLSGYLGFVFSYGLASQIDRWIVLYSIVAVGLALTFVVQKWFISLFDVGENMSHQYSFFGTIVPAFLLSFVWRMLVSLYSDLLAKPEFPLFSMFLLIFFIWVTWCVTMACFVWEKISRNIINATLSSNTSRMQRRRRWNFIVKLFLLNVDMNRFAFNENTNLQAYFAWLMGIVLGILGCLLYIIPIFALSFLLVSIFFVSLGTYHFCRMSEIDFSRL